VISWLLLLAPTARADVLFSGGLTTHPLAPLGIVPAWRLGARSGRTTLWVSAAWAQATGDSTFDGGSDALSGFGVIPQLGFRRDLVERVEDSVVPFAAGSASVGVFGYKIDGEAPEHRMGTGPTIPPVGIAGSLGLDAPISSALSVSAELGLDLHTTRIPVDNDVIQGTALLTFGAIHLNIWL
jgi:hypothetical protein